MSHAAVRVEADFSRAPRSAVPERAHFAQRALRLRLPPLGGARRSCSQATRRTLVSTMADDPYEPGAIFASKYRIVREIARGGMATVYEAFHVDMERRVALKIPHLVTQTQGSLT